MEAALSAWAAIRLRPGTRSEAKALRSMVSGCSTVICARLVVAAESQRSDCGALRRATSAPVREGTNPSSYRTLRGRRAGAAPPGAPQRKGGGDQGLAPGKAGLPAPANQISLT